ncbi:branched-chain amino acid ABC transporter permease [Brachybacterium sp. AOP35-5H-19]|uniref:branched-chain amino acid ABC transporter permease n=1 Tax=Brachybacterium sp. AOP35-5H-19 TaxID=3457685 RepID=UPI004033B180
MLINILDGLAIGGLLFLLSVGLTLIFGLVDVLNLSHGAIYMVGGYLALSLTGGGRPTLLGMLFILAVIVVVGMLLGFLLNLALKPIAGRDHLTQALLTLGLSMIVSEIVLLFAGRGFKTLMVAPELSGSFSLAGNPFPIYRLVVIGVSLVLAIVMYLVFERTKLGSLTRAAIDDAQMLASLGYNVSRIRVSVIALGTTVAAVAGVLGAPLLNLRPGLDSEVLTLALIVVVVGGLGSIKGVAIGAVVIGLLQTLGAAYFPVAAAYLLFGVMLIVLLVRPQGLFGRTA